MKRLTPMLLLGLPLLFLAGCATTGSAPATAAESTSKVLHTRGLGNKDAAEQLLAFLNDNGISAKTVKDGLLLVEYNDSKYFMETKVKTDHIDRVVVSKVFTVKEDFRNSAELHEFVLKLNSKLNLGSFSLTKSEKMVVVQTAITFVDDLDLEEIRAFLHWYKTSLATMIVAAPETVKYLK